MSDNLTNNENSTLEYPFDRMESATPVSSIGVIEGDTVHIFEGSLQGMEGLIRKIDRHKRMAYLEVEMFGRMVEMRAGLEIIEKITAD